MAKLPEMMTASCAAEMLGISTKTLLDWKRRGEGPPSTRKGKRVYYIREQVKDWLRAGASSGGTLLGSQLPPPLSRGSPSAALPSTRRG